jgi:hypothetical protein
VGLQVMKYSDENDEQNDKMNMMMDYGNPLWME